MQEAASTLRPRRRRRQPWGAYLLALLRALLQLADLCALCIQGHLHEKHLALLGNEVAHVFLLLSSIPCGSGNQVKLRLLQRRAHGLELGVCCQQLCCAVLLDALLPHMQLLGLLPLLPLAGGLLLAQREYLLV